VHSKVGFCCRGGFSSTEEVLCSRKAVFLQVEVVFDFPGGLEVTVPNMVEFILN